MQLSRKKVAGLLSAATCSLLGTTGNAAEHEWDVDTAVLFYDEEDGRISAFEPVISAKKDLGDEEFGPPDDDGRADQRPPGPRSYPVSPGRRTNRYHLFLGHPGKDSNNSILQRNRQGADTNSRSFAAGRT